MQLDYMQIVLKSSGKLGSKAGLISEFNENTKCIALETLDSLGNEIHNFLVSMSELTAVYALAAQLEYDRAARRVLIRRLMSRLLVYRAATRRFVKESAALVLPAIIL